MQENSELWYYIYFIKYNNDIVYKITIAKPRLYIEEGKYEGCPKYFQEGFEFFYDKSQLIINEAQIVSEIKIHMKEKIKKERKKYMIQKNLLIEKQKDKENNL